MIGRYGIGVDNIAVAEATARGIPVTNVPAYCLDEVAEHVLGLIFALARMHSTTTTPPSARATGHSAWAGRSTGSPGARWASSGSGESAAPWRPGRAGSACA